MTKEEYFKFHQQCLDKMREITRKKNADYTGASSDPFANFKQVEAFGVISTEEGMFTRMSDKFARLASFLKQGILEVKDESVEDTLLDLANYCILFASYLHAKKKTAVEKVYVAPSRWETLPYETANQEQLSFEFRKNEWIAP